MPVFPASPRTEHGTTDDASTLQYPLAMHLEHAGKSPVQENSFDLLILLRSLIGAFPIFCPSLTVTLPAVYRLRLLVESFSDTRHFILSIQSTRYTLHFHTNLPALLLSLP